MEIVRPQFVPDASLTREEMKQLQHSIADTAVFSDAVDVSPPLTVAGVDQAFLDDRVISGAVAVADGEVVEKTSVVRETPIPYIPGLLAFREGNAVLDALQALDTDVDVVLCDGSGRIHFRQAGIATHVGVTLDVPTVGVAKNLLCGRTERDIPTDLPAGSRIPVLADANVTADEKTVIGYAFQSKQYTSGDRHVNPLYVSPGHRVGNETAVDLVDRYCTGYKLPEPVRIADRFVAETKQAAAD